MWPGEIGKSIRQAMVDDQMILLCSQSEVNIEEPTEEDIYRVGTIAKVRQMLKLPNGTIRVLVEGSFAQKSLNICRTTNIMKLTIKELPEQEID